jgi:hypothetical protein
LLLFADLLHSLCTTYTCFVLLLVLCAVKQTICWSVMQPSSALRNDIALI